MKLGEMSWKKKIYVIVIKYSNQPLKLIKITRKLRTWATYNCWDASAFSCWNGLNYLHECNFSGRLLCSLSAEESGQRVVLGVVNHHSGLEDWFVGRALFEGMVFRGWKASFLRILLKAALEYVAILHPCAKSSIQQLRKYQCCKCLGEIRLI